jgi:hypothetical protein
MSKELNIFKGKRHKIAELLNKGKSPNEVMKATKATYSEVQGVFSSAIFQDWQRSQALSELGGRGARVAIQTLLEVAQDKKAASQSRVSASDKLLHYTGLKLDAEGNIDKSPSNMNASELQQRLQDLQKEAMNRVKTINVIEGQSETIEDDNLNELLK